MDWRIEFSDTAVKQLEKLDKSVQTRILKYLRERLLKNKSPRSLGKGLTGDKAGLWRYRIGDYRIICKIEDNRLIVLVLGIGHRKEIYD